MAPLLIALLQSPALLCIGGLAAVGAAPPRDATAGAGERCRGRRAAAHLGTAAVARRGRRRGVLAAAGVRQQGCVAAVALQALKVG
ncbi:MAG: hypothetical protein J3K34DRAFT_409369 [Monoraphidium minutum]|nr:MAG: hypothetical protein J3K34DRAFT_409369 [Monoraphidium minutum]